MAKQTIPSTKQAVQGKVPRLIDLVNEYKTYWIPFVKELLRQTKAGANGNQNYCERIAKGLHTTNAKWNAPTKWLKCVDSKSLSGLKTIPRCSHQRCIANTTINNFIKDLLNSNILNNTYNVFEDLYDDVNKLRRSGLGDLFIYDATIRIGYDKGILPSKYEYLHSGALKGAKLLAKRGVLNLRKYTSNPTWKLHKYHRIPTVEFSNLLPGMKAIDIEVFLCIAKQYFPTMLIP